VAQRGHGRPPALGGLPPRHRRQAGRMERGPARQRPLTGPETAPLEALGEPRLEGQGAPSGAFPLLQFVRENTPEVRSIQL